MSFDARQRRPHRCDAACVCPLDGLPLFFARGANEHACSDPDCANAHGMTLSRCLARTLAGPRCKNLTARPFCPTHSSQEPGFQMTVRKERD